MGIKKKYKVTAVTVILSWLPFGSLAFEKTSLAHHEERNFRADFLNDDPPGNTGCGDCAQRLWGDVMKRLFFFELLPLVMAPLGPLITIYYIILDSKIIWYGSTSTRSHLLALNESFVESLPQLLIQSIYFGRSCSGMEGFPEGECYNVLYYASLSASIASILKGAGCYYIERENITAAFLGSAEKALSGVKGGRLREACCAGDLAVVETLLRKGIDPNAADYFGNTPLGSAAKYGSEDVARALLNAGADPNLGNPLQKAQLHHQVAVARALLEAGADPKNFEAHSHPYLVKGAQGVEEVLSMKLA